MQFAEKGEKIIKDKKTIGIIFFIMIFAPVFIFDVQSIRLK